jgi:glycerol-3-phosphate cytidylyltransferase
MKDKKPQIRFLGTDYAGKSYTGQDLGIPIHYIDRSHGWSTTGLRERIWQAEEDKKNRK